jgi:TIR domain/Superinfection immunity protein
MADVFISYSRKDEAMARLVFEKLRAEGFSVWWDPSISPGQKWDQVICSALERASCIVVLWSRNSVGSDFVREEANCGARRHVLVPLMIDKVDPPFGFGLIEAADLSDWRGESTHPEFANARDAIARLVPRTKPIPKPVAQPDRPVERRKVTPLVTPLPQSNSARGPVFPFIALVVGVAALFSLFIEGLKIESPALLCACGVLLYFLPVLVAAMRLKRDGSTVVKKNALQGWTGKGWIEAMKLALAEDK